jgi:hypothetical protein
MTSSIIERYLPRRLTRKEHIKQRNFILKSRRLYKTKKYFERPHINSFHSKPSKHIENAKRIYKVNSISPNHTLSKATGCSVKALKKIMEKGEGAYYSSGSRPNQTAQSWGRARLASALTGANASKVDYKILEQGCEPKSRVIRMAKKRLSL